MGLSQANIHPMNKSDFLAAINCTTMAWRQTRHAPPLQDEATRFRMEEGREIGEFARQLFPDGILVTGHGEESIAETQRHIADNAATTLFEPFFVAGVFIAKVDALRRNGDGWDVFEAKSSFEDSSKVRKDYLDDLAYTVMTLRSAGLDVKSSALLLLSREYRYGGPVQELFTSLDMTDYVNARAEQFQAAAGGIAVAVLADEMPHPLLSRACRGCDFFQTACLGSRHEHTVLELPRLHANKLDQLSAAGTVDIAAVPAHIKLTATQQRVKSAAESGETFVDREGLRRALAAIEWPCHYLDFETVSTAMPLYPGNGCRQSVLTQFSVHCRDGDGAEVRHSEFLADATESQERLLAERLVEVLGVDGSIAVYTSFEDRQINGLIDKFPDLAEPLNAIRKRLVDFMKIIKTHVYHPALAGSFSLKKVVPALVPEVGYEGLAVADGDNAMAMFARMARGEIEAVAEAREQLLAYCKMDTFVMVRLHDVLDGMAA